MLWFLKRFPVKNLLYWKWRLYFEKNSASPHLSIHKETLEWFIWMIEKNQYSLPSIIRS